jgi:DNA-binding XRE family transcriptional regulator
MIGLMARTVFGEGVFDGQPAPEACLRMLSMDRLRAFRMRHSISQTTAAALINTPMRTWAGWEAQRREPPLCLWVLLDYIDRFGPLKKATINGVIPDRLDDPRDDHEEP